MTSSEIRSQLYRLFASYVAFPEEDNWRVSLTGSRLVLLDEQVSQLPYPLAFSDLDIEAGTSLERLNMFYTMSFETGTGLVSLHERAYSNKGEKKLFEELFRFYQHFGLDLSKNDNDFWPDALQIQLEFMHYLTYLQSVSNGDVEHLLKAQRDFLSRHLGPLIRGVCEALTAKDAGFYKPLMKNIEEFVSSETRYLNEHIGDQVLAIKIA